MISSLIGVIDERFVVLMTTDYLRSKSIITKNENSDQEIIAQDLDDE